MVGNALNSRSAFWSRFTICILCLSFFILYTTQYHAYRGQYSLLSQKYSQCVVYSEGMAAQIQLLMDRSQRAERIIEKLRIKQITVMKESSERYRMMETEWMRCTKHLKACDLGTLKRQMVLADDLRQKVSKDNTLVSLQAQLEAAQARMLKFSQSSNCSDDERIRIREEILSENENCANKVNMRISGVDDVPKEIKLDNSVTTSYVVNETVRFQRKQPGSANLEFERDDGNFRMSIVPNKMIMEKLKERIKDIDKHPDDRNLGNGAEIIDLPDENEKDYKNI